MAKFKDTFLIESARLKEWDYSNPWWYYVTINTKDHTEYFGKIENGKMILNDLGNVVDNGWKEIPIHFKNVELDYYVIMPNHVHGIIIITECRDAINCVSTDNRTGGITGLKNPQLNPNSLSNVIRQYKARCSFEIRKSNPSFAWQPRFYDRIIRNEKELLNIRRYIEQNPLKWEFEKNNTENIFDL